jgi:hypothetical protein
VNNYSPMLPYMMPGNARFQTNWDERSEKSVSRWRIMITGTFVIQGRLITYTYSSRQTANNTDRQQRNTLSLKSQIIFGESKEGQSKSQRDLLPPSAGSHAVGAGAAPPTGAAVLAITGAVGVIV